MYVCIHVCLACIHIHVKILLSLCVSHNRSLILIVLPMFVCMYEYYDSIIPITYNIVLYADLVWKSDF